MPHAIEKRNNHGLVANGRSEIVHGGFQSVGFDRHQHDIIRRPNLACDSQLWSNREIPVGTDHLEPRRLETLGPFGTDQKGHIPSGLGQSSAEIAAYRACANHEDSWVCSRCLISVWVCHILPFLGWLMDAYLSSKLYRRLGRGDVKDNSYYSAIARSRYIFTDSVAGIAWSSMALKDGED